MTRIDSARHAAGSAKDSVRHAAEAMAPYAESAREHASHYAHEAGAYLGPKVSSAAHQARHAARDNYDAHVVPRLAQARGSLPPEFEKNARKTARKAAKHTRKAARQADRYARPHLEHAREAAEPARREAAARGAAAYAALRGEITPRDLRRISRRRDGRARVARLAKRLGVLGLLAGGAYAAWRWWDRQANPDWLVEPPPATEVIDEEMEAMQEDDAGRALLDPEVEAKQRDDNA
ncbi:DUF5324 family protein [Streptomyces sp. TR06-5]|uniref:DUF5324 family protein n=1 Tax=unclassified Streptomyces TaxID=2593676 RepID=UPI00399F2421